MKNNIINWIHNNIECKVYDYTKIIHRKSTPEYHLTYSLSEKNHDKCKFILKTKQGNIAVVFNLKNKNMFPETFMGYPVISGDETDLRFLDKQPGYIIGLRSKGDAIRNKNGFSIYKGNKYLDNKEDNNLLKDPVIDDKPRILKFKDYTNQISFSKKNIERRLNEFIRSERPLLSSKGNPKLDKGNKYNYITYGLSLAPARTNGHMNFCPSASPGCLSSCLYTSGSMLGFRNKINARLLRSWLFVFKRDIFFQKLKIELLKGYNKCKKEKHNMALRLNVFSDLPFEKIDMN